jgi:bifunctional non-homologous end joining protein LigD
MMNTTSGVALVISQWSNFLEIKPHNLETPMSNSVLQSARLLFQNSRSDKEYNVSLAEQDDGCLVNFSYGPRGGTLKYGTKTISPVSLDAAEKVFNRLVKSKVSKGYSLEGSGCIQAPVFEDFVWFTPQLLNTVSHSNLSALVAEHGDLYLQEKFDGERRAVLLDFNAASESGKIKFINKKGKVINVRDSIHHAISSLHASMLNAGSTGLWILDGEDLGAELVLFDVLDGDKDAAPFSQRAPRLALLKALTSADSALRFCLPERCALSAVNAFIENKRSENAEGVVVRLPTSVYESGRPNSGGSALKLKFTESATVEVESISSTKRSIGIRVYDFASDGAPIGIGNCTIPPNHQVPSVGDLVEVEYLYWNKGGSLIQPTYKGSRRDVDKSDARLVQLKEKRSSSACAA